MFYRISHFVFILQINKKATRMMLRALLTTMSHPKNMLRCCTMTNILDYYNGYNEISIGKA